MALRLETPSPHSMSSLAAPSLDTKIVGLRNLLADLHRVIVCFSGGVDSGYLLAEAVGTLGRARTYALTAVSPSLAPQERSDAAEIAKQLGAQHLLVDTHELDDARYAANPVNRCYFCKTEVYSTAVDEAHRLGLKHVLDGFNIRTDCWRSRYHFAHTLFFATRNTRFFYTRDTAHVKTFL